MEEFTLLSLLTGPQVISLYCLALCELFDKTDTGGDGTISLKEYMAMCDEYGIELTDEHINDVKSISNENGEVFVYFDIKVGF